MRDTMRSKQSIPSAAESEMDARDGKKDGQKKKVPRIFSPVKIKIDG